MKKTRITKLLSLTLCIVLIAAMALMATGCDDKDLSTKEFTLVVVDVEGKETSIQVVTNQATVGDALLEQNIIAGEDSQYGLYVKTVNGITLDCDIDGKYWAFYVNGEYAMSGVDTTDIVAGDEYAFKAE